MIIKFWFRLIILGIFFEQHARFIVKDLLRKLVITLQLVIILQQQL